MRWQLTGIEDRGDVINESDFIDFDVGMLELPPILTVCISMSEQTRFFYEFRHALQIVL
jgi:hypothetical protein